METMNKYVLHMWRLKFKKRFKSKCMDPAVALIATRMQQGGLEQVILDLYHGYKKNGLRAYIVCQKWSIDSVKDLVDSPEDIFVFEDDLQSLIHFLWRRDVRTVHYHHNIFGIKELKFIGIKILYTMHNTYTWLNDEEIKSYAERLSYADYMIPVSENVKEYFCKRTSCEEKNIRVINNGIDFSSLDNDEYEQDINRESLGINKDDITIGVVGSFYHAKGQIGMIGVAERIIVKYPQVKFVFLGSDGDNSYYTRFLKELYESPAKESIILAPAITHTQMGHFYRSIIDILALATIHEGNPLVAIEAMYCEKPMVLTPVGIAEELSHRAACLVCESACNDLSKVTDLEIKTDLSMRKHAPNEDSVVRCLSEIIDDLDAYRTKAHESKKNVSDYSVDRMISKYVKLVID